MVKWLITFCLFAFLAKIAFASPTSFNQSKNSINYENSLQKFTNPVEAMSGRVLKFDRNKVEMNREEISQASSWPDEKEWLMKNVSSLLK